MAWIESNQGIKDHPKTLLLASRMGWDVYSTIGRLHCFWWWCLEYAPTGDLRKFNDAVLAGSVGLSASEGSLFVTAMVEACWLDRGRNVFRVHDWVEYAGRYLRDSKFKNKPEKWQEVLGLYKVECRQKVSRKSAVPNQPDLTNQTNQPDHIQTDWSFENIWSRYPLKDGKINAEKKFKALVQTEEDWLAINKALDNYLGHLKANAWKRAKNGDTWFNNWRDWVNWVEPEQGAQNGRGQGYPQQDRTQAGGIRGDTSRFENTAEKFD